MGTALGGSPPETPTPSSPDRKPWFSIQPEPFGALAFRKALTKLRLAQSTIFLLAINRPLLLRVVISVTGKKVAVLKIEF